MDTSSMLRMATNSVDWGRRALEQREETPGTLFVRCCSAEVTAAIATAKPR
jgi:hypothetical protein